MYYLKLIRNIFDIIFCCPFNTVKYDLMEKSEWILVYHSIIETYLFLNNSYESRKYVKIKLNIRPHLPIDVNVNLPIKWYALLKIIFIEQCNYKYYANFSIMEILDQISFFVTFYILIDASSYCNYFKDLFQKSLHKMPAYRPFISIYYKIQSPHPTLV